MRLEKGEEINNMLKTLHRSLEKRESELEEILKQMQKLKCSFLSNQIDTIIKDKDLLKNYLFKTESALIGNRETLAYYKPTEYRRVYEQIYDDIDTFTFNNRELLSRLQTIIPQDEIIYSNQAILDIYKVKIDITENMVTLKTPHLLTHRRKKSALCEPIVKSIYEKAKQTKFPQFDKAVIVSNIINPENGKHYVDCDNIEYIKIINALTLFTTPNDDSVSCFHFAMGDVGVGEGTEITIMSQDEFPNWIGNILNKGKK